MNNTSRLLFYFLISTSFINCSTVKINTLVEAAPFVITAPYYNSWVAGVQGGGSRINVFLPVSDTRNIVVDSIHFRGEKAIVVKKGSLIVGRFKTSGNQSRDLIMSSNPKDEYQKKLVYKADVSSFVLANNECVISYRLLGKRHYYKVSDLKKGEVVAYPSAQPKKP
tara:strand:- start:651 stop:1151 length:501 start_codon:yes stop_codon:yes gene_type:complete